MLIWAAVMLESRVYMTISTRQEQSMVEWDHETESGAILHVTATAADAANQVPPLTLREWVTQLMEWFPPRVEGN
jgi:hypothetical protein